MGNSSTSICWKSKKQQLEDSFDCFNTACLNLQEENNEEDFKCGNIITVIGNNQIKGNLYKTGYLINFLEVDKQIQYYWQRHSCKLQTVLPIVKVHGIKLMQSAYMCTMKKLFYVITEDLTTFDHIGAILSFQQCLFVLFQCLIGFYHLYLRHLDFGITQKMISFNQNGEIKIWHNQNLGQNHPNDQKPVLLTTKFLFEQHQQNRQFNIHELQMIKEILQILNTKYSETEEKFQQIFLRQLQPYLNDCNYLGFEKVLEGISKYQQANLQTLYIPNKIILKVQTQGQNRLQPRQSFSIRLQKAKQEFQYERKSRQIIEENINLKQQGQQLKQSRQTSFSTGKNGNTLSQYFPKVNFSYQSPLNFTQNKYLLNSNSFYSSNESKFYNQALNKTKQFRTRYNTENSTQGYVHTYITQQNTQDLNLINKDFNEATFKSTGDSNHFYTPTSKVQAQVQHNFPYFNHSNSQNQLLFHKKQQKFSQLSKQQQEKNHNFATQSNQNFCSNRQYISSLNSNYNFSNLDLMRISEQISAKEESYRQSLANKYIVEGSITKKKQDFLLSNIVQNQQNKLNENKIQKVDVETIQSRYLPTYWKKNQNNNLIGNFLQKGNTMNSMVNNSLYQSQYVKYP